MNVLPSVTAVLAVSLGLAAQNPPPPASSRAAVEHEVREFIRAAGESGQAELAFAGIAKQRSQQAVVRDLAARLEREQKATNQELVTLAKARRVDIPEMTAADRVAQRTLEGLSGAAFDREFIVMMVRGHDASLALFSAAVKSTDAGVRALAEKTLPALRAHIEAIERARKAIGGTDPPK
jgi:putative membrane protein